MKEIRNTKTVEVTEIKFVANDGTEFDVAKYGTEKSALEHCEQHERLQNKKLINRLFNEIQQIYISNYFDDANGTYILHIRNFDEWKICCDYFSNNFYDNYIDIIKQEPKSYPTDVIVNHSYEWCDITRHCIVEGKADNGDTIYKKDDNGDIIIENDTAEYVLEEYQKAFDKIKSFIEARDKA